jgi:C-terminal processing protease CtpA/Prc
MRAALILSGGLVVLLLLPAILLAGEADKETVIVKVRAEAGDDDTEVVTIELTGDDVGWLGVGIADLDEKKRDSMGVDKEHVVIVTEVYEDSPGEEAGIHAGDVVISVSGNDVRSTKQLADMIGDMDPYTKLEIELLRNGKRMVKNAVLGVRPYRFVFADDEGERTYFDLEGLEALGKLGRVFFPRMDIGVGWGGKGRLGVYVDDLSDGLAEYFEVPDGKGVLVEEVVKDSPAEAGGIRAGDVIIKIGDTKVSDTDELIDAISGMTADVETPIVIVRKGSEIPLKVTVTESGARKYMTALKRMQSGGDHVIAISPNERHIVIEDLEELRGARKEVLQEEIEELREALKELKKEMEELKTDNQ